MQQNIQQLTKERFQSNKIIREKFINFIQDYPNLKSFEFHWTAYHCEIEKSFVQINSQSNHYHLLKEEEQESLLFLNDIKKKELNEIAKFIWKLFKEHKNTPRSISVSFTTFNDKRILTIY